MKKLLLLFCFALIMGQSFAQVYELTNDYPMSGPFSRFDGKVNAMSLDSNGKLVVGGDFTDYNGTTRNNLARLNADGTVDVGFDPGVSLTSTVYDVAVHSDNTITVATVGGLKRFDNTGTEITGPTFVPDAADYVIKVVAAEPTGLGVIIAGSFTDVGGTTAKGIARLNADGTIDATFATKVGTGFNVTGTLSSNEITSIEITSGGKILVGGDFTSFNGTTRYHLALLNSDGSLDTNFDPGTTLSSDPGTYSVAMQADGKILAGSYSYSQGAGKLVRFSATGTEEFSAYITNTDGISAFQIFDIVTEGTNDILIGTGGAGGLFSVDYSSGVVNPVFAGKGVYIGDINSLVLNTDGSIIVGGSFSDYNGIISNNIAKVATCGVSIDTQPINVTTCETTNAEFTVVASGTGTLNYQWQYNADAFGTGLYTDIVDDATYGGATTATLAITGATTAMNNYYYRCIITDDNCSSTTDVKQLTVNPDDQVITVDPQDATVCVGSNAIFSVTVTGTEGGYQWQEDAGTGSFVDLVNGGIYSGVTSKNVVITGATSNMNGFKYRLKSTLCDPSGVFSASAILTVNELPVITEQPADVGICVSGDASYTVVATGSGLTYQWQYAPTGDPNNMVDLTNNANFSGVTTATLTLINADKTLPEISNVGDISIAYFKCVVTSNGCSVSSGGEYLRIYKTPTITKQPVSYSNCVAAGGTGSATFYPVVDIGIGVSYQWEYDNGNGFVPISDNAIYSGTSTRVLNLTDASSSYSGEYRVLVGTCSPLIYSDVAVFQLDEKPELTVLSETNPKICLGGSVEMEIGSSNSQVAYQWQRQPQNGSFVNLTDDAKYSGTNTSLLSITNASLNDHFARYRLVTTNGACDVNSNLIRLEVYSQPILSNGTLTSALTVCDGGSTSLRVNSGNTDGITAGLMSYKWQADVAGNGIFSDIDDGNTYSYTTTKKLSIDVASLSLNGTQFRCVIKGCSTSETSVPVTLNVLQLPLVTTSPQSQTVCHSEQVTFTAEATGSDITYSWWRDTGDGNFQQVRSANTNPDYTFVANAAFNGYKYKCIATAGNCTTTSESFEAILTVHETRITATSERSLGICVGEPASFSVTMSNEEGLSFQWSDGNGVLSDGDLYGGVTTSTLTIGAITTPINNYSVAITGDCGSQSTSFQLLVYGIETPVIETNFGNPTNPQIFVNSTFALGVDNYEWFLDGNSYQNTGSQSSVNIDQEGSYTVVATKNNCDHPESEAVVVIVTGFENSLSANTVSMYPNPVNNKLTLEMGNDFDTSKESKIILTNTKGKQVYTKRYNDLYNRKVDIDMAGFESGIYIVSVINGDNIVQYKITKQ